MFLKMAENSKNCYKFKILMFYSKKVLKKFDVSKNNNLS